MAKKILLGFLLICFCLGLSFLIRRSFNYIVCTYTTTKGDITLKTEHSLKLNDKYVSILISKETIISNDKDFLYTYRDTLEEKYKSYKKLKYYDNDIEVFKNKLVVTTKIDYQKINIEELVNINKDNEKIFTNGKVYYKTLKKEYEDLGAVCKYKNYK